MGKKARKQTRREDEERCPADLVMKAELEERRAREEAELSAKKEAAAAEAEEARLRAEQDAWREHIHDQPGYDSYTLGGFPDPHRVLTRPSLAGVVIAPEADVPEKHTVTTIITRITASRRTRAIQAMKCAGTFIAPIILTSASRCSPSPIGSTLHRIRRLVAPIVDVLCCATSMYALYRVLWGGALDFPEHYSTRDVVSLGVAITHDADPHWRAADLYDDWTLTLFDSDEGVDPNAALRSNQDVRDAADRGTKLLAQPGMANVNFQEMRMVCNKYFVPPKDMHLLAAYQTTSAWTDHLDGEFREHRAGVFNTSLLPRVRQSPRDLELTVRHWTTAKPYVTFTCDLRTIRASCIRACTRDVETFANDVARNFFKASRHTNTTPAERSESMCAHVAFLLGAREIARGITALNSQPLGTSLSACGATLQAITK
jgi:hypothetical protein